MMHIMRIRLYQYIKDTWLEMPEMGIKASTYTLARVEHYGARSAQFAPLQNRGRP